MIKRITAILTSLAIILLLLGCGKKLALPDDLPPPDFSGSNPDTSYLQMSPDWTSADGIPFNHPHDIYLGYDGFIYICDTDNHRIVQLTLDGTFQESYTIKHPVAVTQDRALDLIAVAGDYKEVEVINPTRNDTTFFGNAIYRLSYFGEREFKTVWTAPLEYHEIHIGTGGSRIVEAEFWGVAVSPDIDKNYFITDFWKDRILKFTIEDRPVPFFINHGFGIGQTEYPEDVYTYEIVGQNFLAYSQGGSGYGAQVISIENGKPVFGDTLAIPDLLMLKTNTRKDIAVDDFLNYYVLLEKPQPLTGKNHLLYKFNRDGDQLLEFGIVGNGELMYFQPRGIDVANGIIYIADTGNNRIVRLQLSTNVQQ